MHRRRKHTKSQNGCNQCKKRHLKCDEEHPICTNCKDYRDSCTYSSKPMRGTIITGARALNSRLSPDATKSSTGSSTASPITANSAMTTSAPRVKLADDSAVAESQLNAKSRLIAMATDSKIFTIMDMQLLNHYSTVVYSTLSAVVEQREAWRTSAVNVALHHKFFLQGLLALSALHMAHVTPDQARSYLLIAATHQDDALAEFRRLLGYQVNSETFAPLFLFSCFLAIYAFALPGVEGMLDHEDALKNGLYGFLGGVQLIRGAKELLIPWYEILAKSELAVLLDSPWKEPRDETSITESLPLSQLYAICETQSETKTANIYSSAIEHLHTAFRCTKEPNGSSTTAIALMWPIAVPKDYLELLQEQNPKAMVILAHYAVLLHEHRSCWYLQSWGKQLIDRIAVELGAEWEWALSWPKKMVGLD